MYFLLFVEVIQLLLEETNKYYSPVMEHGFLKSISKILMQSEMVNVLVIVFVHCQDNYASLN
jgi:hypothetical protein